MKQGLKLAIFLVILVFIVSACTSYENAFTKRGKEEVGRGLKLSFAPNTIPDVIRVDQRFPIFVKIENFAPIPLNGKIRIYDQIEGGIEMPSTTITIPGGSANRDINNRIIGGIIPGTVDFPGRDEDRLVVYRKGDVYEGARANIHAELIIEGYEVSETFPLCVKRENVNVPCSNNEVETFSNTVDQYRPITYSPVTISRVEKTVAPLGKNEFSVNLDITLDNLGGGDIVSGSFLNDPTGDDVFREGAVKLTSVTFGGRSLTCSPQDEVVFTNQKGVLNCVGITTLDTDYEDKRTHIGFTFNYRMKIKKGPIPIINGN